MSGIIRVTPEQLQAVSGQLNAGAGNIDGALRQLGSSVEPLGGDWAGVAQARFQELWGQWQRDALGLHDSLTEISRLMAQAAANYESTDSQTAAYFRV